MTGKSKNKRMIYIRDEDKIYFDILEEYIYQKRNKEISMSSEITQAVKTHSKTVSCKLKLNSLSEEFKKKLLEIGFIR
jgi:hypothetical protein